MSKAFSIVFITTPDGKTADLITDTLLEKKIAACVNQIPGVKSKYWWEGKIEQAQEVLLIVKTQTEKIPSVIQTVNEKHPYSVPEAISVSITDGSKPYLDWLEASTLHH